MKRLVLCIALFLPYFPAWSSIASFLPSNSEVGLGFWNSHLKKIQTHEIGDRNIVKLRPHLQGALTWQLPKELALSLETRLGLPHSGRNENIKRWHYELNTPLSWRINQFSLRAGPGLAFLRLWGPGGRVALDNGLDTTEFFLPSEASTSLNLFWMLGVDWALKPEWSLRFEGQVFNLFDTPSRTLSHTISLHYHFQFTFKDSP
jgi:hypothetical protein